MLHCHPAGSVREGISSALTGYPYAEGGINEIFQLVIIEFYRPVLYPIIFYVLS